ncbi:hypothetical protein LX36DRAFT_576540 [Colletotrichum falcatum]|nr:hypothetical protein LX36DRAFT_576540 [Colletotrichum falcatum]
MDPRWMEARTRYRTPKPRRSKDVLPAGRFRKKLEANPYALALTTPVRFCPISEVSLPKYFLQELKPIENPETKTFWWTPGDLDSPIAQQKATENLLRRSPACYVIARKPFFKSLSGSKRQSPHGEKWRGLLSRRDGRLVQQIVKKQVWREDMDDFILDNMRRNVMKYLVYFAELRAGQDHRSYILRLGSWERAAKIPQRGCLLWYRTVNGPQRQGGAALKPFATYDVPKAKYERTLPVYDLMRLLGEDHLAKLREIPMFRDSSLFLLRKQRSIPLQLYLWKLQAYMAEDDAPKDARPSESESADDQPSSTGAKHSTSSHEKDAAIPAPPGREGHKDSRGLEDRRDPTPSGLSGPGHKDPKKAWQSQAGHKKNWTEESPSAPHAPVRQGL